MAKDEAYILDLCDAVLGLASVRQHRFPFLVGDPGKNGRARSLPVDAYYPSLNLVIEYQERQHSEPVPFMDKRVTVSGVSRGEQRRLYDERRSAILPASGICLIELDYAFFAHAANKRLRRDRTTDESTVREKLKAFCA